MELSAQGTPKEEIAQQLGVEPAFVNLVLAKNGDSAAERDIDDQQLELLRRHALQLAMQTEDLAVSAKMTRFLIERDKPKTIQQTSPLVNINAAIITAQESFKKLTASYFGSPPAIETPASENPN